MEDRSRHVRAVADALDLEERLANLVSDRISPRIVRRSRSSHGAESRWFHRVHVLRPNPALSPELLLHYVLQEEFRKSARAHMTGTAGQLRVPARFLDEQTIPVPPLLEQHRIVVAIESYFTRLDDAGATLERVQRNLKRYRASVLKAAVEGRLVPTEAELARARDATTSPRRCSSSASSPSAATAERKPSSQR